MQLQTLICPFVVVWIRPAGPFGNDGFVIRLLRRNVFRCEETWDRNLPVRFTLEPL